MLVTLGLVLMVTLVSLRSGRRFESINAGFDSPSRGDLLKNGIPARRSFLQGAQVHTAKKAPQRGPRSFKDSHGRLDAATAELGSLADFLSRQPRRCAFMTSSAEGREA